MMLRSEDPPDLKAPQRQRNWHEPFPEKVTCVVFCCLRLLRQFTNSSDKVASCGKFLVVPVEEVKALIEIGKIQVMAGSRKF